MSARKASGEGKLASSSSAGKAPSKSNTYVGLKRGKGVAASSLIRSEGRPAHPAGTRAATEQDASIERAVSQYRRMLRGAGRNDRVRLMEAVSAETETARVGPDAELDEELWGAAPTPAVVAAARLEATRSSFSSRRTLESQSVTRDDAAELLGISAQAVTDHLQRGDLVGLKVGTRWLLPLWQFDANASKGFLPDVRRVALAFPGGVVSLSRWMVEPSPQLGGHRPRDEMTRGQVEAVVIAASSLTAAGW